MTEILKTARLCTNSSSDRKKGEAGTMAFSDKHKTKGPCSQEGLGHLHALLSDTKQMSLKGRCDSRAVQILDAHGKAVNAPRLYLNLVQSSAGRLTSCASLDK